jgi:hypothetical protein
MKSLKVKMNDQIIFEFLMIKKKMKSDLLSMKYEYELDRIISCGYVVK